MLTERLSFVGFASVLAMAGCSDGARGRGAPGEEGRGPTAILVSPDAIELLGGDDFFDHPWPSDFRRDDEGFVRFEGYPNHPLQLVVIDEFVGAMAGVLDGFSPAASGFFRLGAPLDVRALPSTPPESLDAASAVQLIDVDERSPERGTRRMVALHWQKDGGVYWRRNTLSFMPAFGYPLRPATRYAAVVTTSARGEDGARAVQSPEVGRLLEDARVASAIDVVEAAGVARSDIVHFTVFTTNDPVADTTALRDWVVDNYPPPSARAWEAKEQAPAYDVYEGVYGPSPDFQRGEIPFVNFGDGGELAFDAAGVPEVQREFDLRFALVVPNASSCSPPPGGYPVVLYAHGTGGDYRSFIRNGSAKALALRCSATMGIDQIFHGNRPGANAGSVEIVFFNVNNPLAARANAPQSAIDVVQQARLFSESQVRVPASVSRTGADVELDGARLSFFGHSQGGLNGPMFFAVDDQVRGGVLSGSGSLISITLLEKARPVDVQALVKSILGLLKPEEQAELNEFHPAVSLVQTIVDTADPIHYVSKIIHDPRSGFAPKSVLMTEGVNPDFTGDTFTPPHGIEVQAVAMGLPPQTPVIHPIEEASWSGLQPVTIPPGGLSGNLAEGAASGVLAQWPASDASDGHFVVFDIPAAMAQAADFLRNLADDPVGRVPAP